MRVADVEAERCEVRDGVPGKADRFLVDITLSHTVLLPCLVPRSCAVLHVFSYRWASQQFYQNGNGATCPHSAQSQSTRSWYRR